MSDISSLRFDFVRRRMELSRVPLIPSPCDDAVKLLDLRARGAPAAAYAVRVQRLLVNGVRIAAYLHAVPRIPDSPLTDLVMVDLPCTTCVLTRPLIESTTLRQATSHRRGHRHRHDGHLRLRRPL
jgi:hypothetical protein